MPPAPCPDVFVVDVDSLDAEFELRKLEAEHGDLPPTVEVITARGRHLYFRMPDMPVRNSAGKIARGVDMSGDGGYVLAPPSIHPSGRALRVGVDSAGAIAAAPDWLLEKITEHTNGTARRRRRREWRALVADGVDEGQRDCTLAKLSGHLLRHTSIRLSRWNCCSAGMPRAAGRRCPTTTSRGSSLRSAPVSCAGVAMR